MSRAIMIILLILSANIIYLRATTRYEIPFIEYLERSPCFFSNSSFKPPKSKGANWGGEKLTSLPYIIQSGFVPKDLVA